jgi:hypothetical protein
MGKRFWQARYMVLWSWNRVDKEIAPTAFEDNVQQVGFDSDDGTSWDVQSLLTIRGISSL